jgi:hypothetical protein
MSQLVVMGALCQCSFGVAPCPLVVLPDKRTLSPTPVATILDNKPIVNLATFGICSSIANPTVAAATAAALGVLTPMPCVPAMVAPWTPGSPTVLIGNIPALNNTSMLMCNWGGVIQITQSGQNEVIIP